MGIEDKLSVIYAKKLSAKIVQLLNEYGEEYKEEIKELWGNVMLNAQVNALASSLIEILKDNTTSNDELVESVCKTLKVSVERALNEH